MRGVFLGLLGLGAIVLLTATFYQNHRRFHTPLITTSYQAVTLGNGTVYYGRLDHLGSDHPVLRDPFVIRIEQDAQTREIRYTLIRRTDEINGADHMIIPATSIAFVEPVAPSSVAGKIIERTKK